MDLGLADRVYVLTGASRGLGFATAEQLVADGARVVLAGRNAERVAAAAQRLGGPERAVGLGADLADADTAERLVGPRPAALRTTGRRAGLGRRPTARHCERDRRRRSGGRRSRPSSSARSAPHVPSPPSLADGGAVALVLSSSVRAPLAGLGISNGLRPGLAAVAKELADEHGPRGVRVLSLLPGRILTDRNRELFAATGDPERARAQAEAAIPLRRLGEPAEFGRVAAFVLSPAAGYLTGVAVPVDGGALRAF